MVVFRFEDINIKKFELTVPYNCILLIMNFKDTQWI